MQEFGLLILYETDQVTAFVQRQQDLVDKLRLAIVTHDPSRLPAMFPAYATPVEDNNEAIKALDTDAPVAIKTNVATSEAEGILSLLEGSLGIDDLGVGDL